MRQPTNSGNVERVRLDVWLDVACLFKTRSEAQKACRSGKVEVNSERCKPNRSIQPADRLSITRPYGRKQLIVVRNLASQHMPKPEARTLYEDITPPLTDAERESYQLDKVAARVMGLYQGRRSATKAPDKRQRRILRRMKGH